MGGGHHHGGHRGGGFRGGFGPAWGWGGGWGYPYPASEVFVVEQPKDDEGKTRAMAYVMSLPKSQRAAAYKKLFGKDAAPGVLGDWPPYQYMNAGGMALDWRQKSGGMSAPWTQPYEYRAADASALGGIFAKKTLDLPKPGKPEIVPEGSPLGGCGCGCNGAGTCKPMGDFVLSTPVKVGLYAVGAYFLYKHLKKKR